MKSENIIRTEQRNSNTMHIDRMGTLEMLRTMNEENRQVPEAVENALNAIVPVVDHISEMLILGGRLIYVGAGTSGRIGLLDAAECPPTFGVSPGTVVGLIAGGEQAMTSAREGVEDNENEGRNDLLAHSPCENDTVIGISASGGAAYVIGALEAARDAGAFTVSLCCNQNSTAGNMAHRSICVDTGPEAITGSTRLKAGTAQKLILNLISTAVMVKTGKVYENYMINVRPTNEKLLRRAVRILCEITGNEEVAAHEALIRADGCIRDAIEQLKGSKYDL